MKLDLSKNQLKELPENFGELTKLKHLDLYKNQLQHLPISFSKLQSLKWLDLKDNPLMPKIAQISGPCLDAKQCQACAKNIVSFYIKLERTITEEKEMREKQRQKSLLDKEAKEAQKQQQQQEKKSKKKQKQQTVTNEKTKLNGNVPQKTGKVKAKKDGKTAQNKMGLFWKLFFYFFTLLTITSLGLFIATSLNLSYTKNLEGYVVQVWKTGVYNNLPSEYQVIAGEAERKFVHVHNITGRQITKIFDKLFKK